MKTHTIISLPGASSNTNRYVWQEVHYMVFHFDSDAA